MPASWTRIRVFISSTFRDMHAERDHLVKITFPRLREWCEKRRLHLDDIDLRWGLSKEEADSGKIIELCLEKVDGCRPFFVSILGSRYGTMPYQMPAEDVAKFPGLQASTHQSITHLEIEYATQGALHQTVSRGEEPHKSAFFYFRDPDCLPGPDVLAEYTAEQARAYHKTFMDQDSDSTRALAELKEKIRRRFADRGQVFEYSGVWDQDADNPEDDSLRGRLTQLDAFGEQVEHNLKEAIEARHPEHFGDLERQDPLAVERSYHEAFIENRTRAFVPLPEVESVINDYVFGTTRKPLVVSGPPGSGKSAALANWVSEYQEDPHAYVLARFIGASPLSTSLHRMLTNLCEELIGHFDLDESVPSDPQILRVAWHRLLEQAGQRGRVVIVLDAVNQLDYSADPTDLDWLTAELPDGIRLIVSALVDDSSPRPETIGAEQSQHSWITSLRTASCKELPMPELSHDQQRAILRNVPSLRAKTLSKEQADLLLENPATQNPLFLLVALEELRVFGSFELLEQKIKELPSPDDGHQESESIVEQMFDVVLARLEREKTRIAPDLVPTLFRLLASAREGLSEADLAQLVSQELSQPEKDVRGGELQNVLRELRPYLLRKGTRQGALVDFYHRSFWKASRARYLADDSTRRQSHTRLAHYFQKQETRVDDGSLNERRLVETAWNWLRALQASGSDPPTEAAWAPLEKLFQDQEFLDAKCKAGMAFELVQECHEAYQLLGTSRETRAQEMMQSLLNLVLDYELQEEPALNRVALHDWLGYATEREFYLSLLKLANTEQWLAQSAHRSDAENFAVKCLDDLLDIYRRMGLLDEAERDLPPILARLEDISDWKALGTSEYRWAYIHFLRGKLGTARDIFSKSVEHAFRGDDAVGGNVSRCLAGRASYLGDFCARDEFRDILNEAGELFEANSSHGLAIRWMMNYKVHLFELAFADLDVMQATKLAAEFRKTQWMLQRSQDERAYRMLSVEARVAMLNENWPLAMELFEKCASHPLLLEGTKTGEAAAREFLDFGIVCIECGQVERAYEEWQRGLECPDDLGNRIWKAAIREAMHVFETTGQCWERLKLNLKR